MALTEAQKRANNKYQKTKVTRVVVKFYPADAALLKKVKEQPQMQTYIKNLIRADMEKEEL